MTCSRKMLNRQIASDRVITTFPQAYYPENTPYKQLNFDPEVKERCTQNRTGTVGLKLCKGVIVGDVAVGKSCLVQRFCHDIFNRDYKATIGVDFEVERFSILSVAFNLQIWDTAGEERFKCIAPSYYRGSNIVIVAFDLTDLESLTNSRRWCEDACQHAEDPVVFLVGTKKDLTSPADYTTDIEPEALHMAEELGAEFWPVSSLSGENVQEFFHRIVALTFDRAVKREAESSREKNNQQIGNLITLNTPKEDPNMYEKKQRQNGCC